jgi:hypothetical protein
MHRQLRRPDALRDGSAVTCGPRAGERQVPDVTRKAIAAVGEADPGQNQGSVGVRIGDFHTSRPEAREMNPAPCKPAARRSPAKKPARTKAPTADQPPEPMSPTATAAGTPVANTPADPPAPPPEPVALTVLASAPTTPAAIPTPSRSKPRARTCSTPDLSDYGMWIDIVNRMSPSESPGERPERIWA